MNSLPSKLKGTSFKRRLCYDHMDVDDQIENNDC